MPSHSPESGPCAICLRQREQFPTSEPGPCPHGAESQIFGSRLTTALSRLPLEVLAMLVQRGKRLAFACAGASTFIVALLVIFASMPRSMRDALSFLLGITAALCLIFVCAAWRCLLAMRQRDAR